MLAVPASAAPAQGQARPKLTATPATPASQVQGAKSASRRLSVRARSLLGPRSSAPPPTTPGNLPGSPPAGFGLTVGAENSDGSAGDQTAPTFPGTPPTEDLRATSTPGAPSGSLTYSFKVKGLFPGSGTVRTDMTTPLVRGTTTDVDTVNVTS